MGQKIFRQPVAHSFRRSTHFPRDYGIECRVVIQKVDPRVTNYGNPTPEFICTSAYYSNPSEHVKALTTRNPSSVAESGAPSGDKRFMLWQPAELKLSSKGGGEVSTDDPVAEMKTRKSPNHEAAVFIADLAKNGIRCLCFVESRAQCESVKREVRTILNKDNCLHLSNKIESYRGGYSRAERRESWKRRLQSNQICALVCTSALEMGIDVGSLDATVHVGVPETSSSLLQQAGRAGRRRHFTRCSHCSRKSNRCLLLR